MSEYSEESWATLHLLTHNNGFAAVRDGQVIAYLPFGVLSTVKRGAEAEKAQEAETQP